MIKIRGEEDGCLDIALFITSAPQSKNALCANIKHNSRYFH